MKGKCLCGAVQYSLKEDPALVFACHCLDCQNWTGSAFGLFAAFRKSAFEVQGSARTHSSKAESGRDITRYFCGDCGSSLYTTLEKAPGVVVVSVGTLANGRELVPRRHSWTKHRHPWLALDAAVQQFEEEMP